MAISKNHTDYTRTTNNDMVYTIDGIPVQDTPAVSFTNATVVPKIRVTPSSPITPLPSAYYPMSPAAQVKNSPYIHVTSREPVMITYCPRCAQQHINTRVRTNATGTTWVCVLVGAFIFWPLCWIPLLVKDCKQTNHYCAGCGAKVGRVKPFQ
jgi:hypothetical protein